MVSGVEAADGFDFVAKKVDTVGKVGIDGVDVDEAAAYGKLAGLLADGFGVVSQFVAEAVDELLQSS